MSSGSAGPAPAGEARESYVVTFVACYHAYLHTILVKLKLWELDSI